MTIGLLKKSQIGICAYTNIPHLICSVHTLAHMDYTPSLYYDTLDLMDISEFEDLMTTSSGEDIPALDEDI